MGVCVTVGSEILRNPRKLCPAQCPNAGLCLVVRKELMAEAAASEKGLSEEEKVREMLLCDPHLPAPLSLPCADVSQHLKTKKYAKNASCAQLGAWFCLL